MIRKKWHWTFFYEVPLEPKLFERKSIHSERIPNLRKKSEILGASKTGKAFPLYISSKRVTFEKAILDTASST